MKRVENYIEFDGSNVEIWRLNKDSVFTPHYKEKIWHRYYYETYDEYDKGVIDYGWGITLRHAKNNALAFLLDKEWDNLPPKTKQNLEGRNFAGKGKRRTKR